MAFRVLLFLGLLLEVVLGALLVYALWPQLRRGKRRPEDEWQEYHEPPRLHWAVQLAMLLTPVALLIGLLALTLRMARGTGSALSTVHILLGPAGRPPSSPLSPLSSAEGGIDSGLVALLVTIAIAGLAVVGMLLLIRHPRVAVPRPASEPRAVAVAVDDGLEALRREHDPRRAVVLAYAALERGLARQGWPRNEAEAPFEYLERLSDAMPLNRSHLRALTELFSIARFSEHPVNEPMRIAAVGHLQAVRADLEAASSTA